MDYNELLESMKISLKSFEKVPYEEAIGASWPYNSTGDMVWNDPEPYFIERSITAISDLLAHAEAAEKERDEEKQQRLYAEQHADSFLQDCENLQKKLEAAEVIIERLKNERDAAVSDLRKLVPAWKWDGEKGQSSREETPKCGCVDFG